jgi:hypothetical protein
VHHTHCEPSALAFSITTFLKLWHKHRVEILAIVATVFATISFVAAKAPMAGGEITDREEGEQ